MIDPGRVTGVRRPWLDVVLVQEQAETFGAKFTDPEGRELTKSVRVSRPTKQDVLTALIFIPFYPGTEAPVAYGPAIWLDATGPATKNFGDSGGKGQIQLEWWVYWMPVEDKAMNVRLGGAPFLQMLAWGGGSTELGAMLEFRVGVFPYDYQIIEGSAAGIGR